MKLRETFQRRFNAALGLLKAWNTDIAKATLRTIRDNAVKIKTFNNVTRQEYNKLASKPSKHDACSFHLFKAHSAKTLRKEAYGYYYDGVIYLNDQMNTRDLAKTLAHEINHFFNDSDLKQCRSKAAQFQEEYRAAVVERLVESNVITRNMYLNCAKHVAKMYNVPMPKRITPPKGAFLRKKSFSS